MPWEESLKNSVHEGFDKLSKEILRQEIREGYGRLHR
jgi:hypothetical protein